MPKHFRWVLALILAASMGLSACGGGGGKSNEGSDGGTQSDGGSDGGSSGGKVTLKLKKV